MNLKLPLDGSEQVEDVVAAFPQAAGWLARHGVICTQCGEVFWGTLAELARSKGKSAESDEIVAELNDFLASGSKTG